MAAAEPAAVEAPVAESSSTPAVAAVAAETEAVKETCVGLSIGMNLS